MRRCGFCCWGSVAEEGGGSDRAHYFISFRGKFDGSTCVSFTEWREEEKITLRDCLSLRGCEPDFVDTSGVTVDDRLSAASQDGEAVLLDRGVETADDWNLGCAQGLGEGVGFEDEIAGAFDGTEKADRFLGEQVEVADRG